MLRFSLGLGLVTLVALSCAGEEEKRKVRDHDAAGGEAGSAGPSAGGNETDPGPAAGAAVGGEPGTGGVDGLAGVSAVGGSPQQGAGAPAGGASNPAGGQSGGGAAPEPVAGAAGQLAMAGAGGAASGIVSQFCSDPNEYYVGEGVCAPCEGVPVVVQQTCVEAFSSKSVVADGEPLAILLTPNAYPREPLPTQANVAYLNPNVTLPHELEFDFVSGHYEILVSGGPDNPSEVIVQPFKIQGACGDSFELTDGVRFLHPEGDTYVVTCPNQT